MTHIPNQDQAEAWSHGSGLQWVANDADMEHVLGAITPRILAHAALQPGEHIIDIGCGSGAVTQAAANAAPGGHAFGVDISSTLLELARKMRTGAVSFENADAQTYGFPRGMADAVISRFGVMFFEDPVAAFGNIRTGLRSGGRLAMACWAPAPLNPWFTVIGAAVAARMGPTDPPPPHSPGPFGLADSGYTLDVLRQAGFANCAVTTEDLTFTHPRGAAGAADTIAKVGPTVNMVNERGGGPTDMAAIRDQVESVFQGYMQNGKLAVPARIHFYTAQNPG